MDGGNRHFNRSVKVYSTQLLDVSYYLGNITNDEESEYHFMPGTIFGVSHEYNGPPGTYHMFGKEGIVTISESQVVEFKASKNGAPYKHPNMQLGKHVKFASAETIMPWHATYEYIIKSDQFRQVCKPGIHINAIPSLCRNKQSMSAKFCLALSESASSSAFI